MADFNAESLANDEARRRQYQAEWAVAKRTKLKEMAAMKAAEIDQLRTENAALRERIAAMEALPRLPAAPVTAPVVTAPVTAPCAPLSWAGRRPMCPVKLDGLQELVEKTNKDEYLNVQALLRVFALYLKKQKMRIMKEGSSTTCHIDITTYTSNEERATKFGTDLLRLLTISEDEMQACSLCASALGVNSTGAFGAYLQNNITKIHGHMLGVLNLLLSGMKMWSMWPPGPRPEPDTPPFLTITQFAGQLLWLPPGWYHQVKTTGYGPEQALSESLGLGRTPQIAHSFAVWCLPRELGEYALSSYASGASEEKQKSNHPKGPSPFELAVLFSQLVKH